MESEHDAPENRARNLVSRMTTSEMIGQLRFDAEEIPKLNIPEYNWWNEGLHGAARSGTATVFPQAIGLAAMFDPEFLRTIGDITSTEQRAKYNALSKIGDRGIYKGLTVWAPNVNIFRDPRWGRGQETYGEDPFLASVLGVAFIKGLQGDGTYLKTAACVKHFAAHSGPEPLRHRFDAIVSPKDLVETYLPAFQACVQKGKVNGVMGGYSALNGKPCCANSFLIQSLLRESWGFGGIYISDCWALKDLHLSYGITSSEEDSAALALNSGCDLNCGSMYRHLDTALEKGIVSEDRIREACTRVMTTRYQLGLFDPECSYNNIGFDQIDTDEHAAVSLEASRRSLVLLQNSCSFLPLGEEAFPTVAVIGPNADNRKALLGNYHGTSSRHITVLEGLKAHLSPATRILYAQGSHLTEDRTERLGEEGDRISEAICSVNAADVAILCLGLDETVEGEMHDDGNGGWAGDKQDLRLPECQRKLLKAVARLGTPIIVVLFSGGAIDPEIDEYPDVKSLVQAWYPGALGGQAIAELLYGQFNPSGRLPVTFYKAATILPEFTDYRMEERTYRYYQGVPLYSFGFGLSYTHFEYSDTHLDDKGKEGVTVSVVISNSGAMDGRETAQTYLWIDHPDFPSNPVLAGFQTAFIPRNSQKEVSIEIPEGAFTVVCRNGTRVSPSGEWYLYIGGHQPGKGRSSSSGSSVCELKVSRL